MCFLFFLQHFTFLLDHCALTFAVEASDAAIRTYDPMARDIRGKGIAPQSLADGLGAATTDAFAQFPVRDCRATRNVQQGEVHPALEVRDAAVLFDYRTYIHAAKVHIFRNIS